MPLRLKPRPSPGEGSGDTMKTILKIVAVQVLVLSLTGIAFGQKPRKIKLRLTAGDGADSLMVQNAVKAKLSDRYEIVGKGIAANFDVDIDCLKTGTTESLACYTSIAFWPASNLTISYTPPTLVVGSADVAEKAALNYILANTTGDQITLLWRVYAGALIGACKNMTCSPNGTDCSFTNTTQ
jgi:hypothetical protein